MTLSGNAALLLLALGLARGAAAQQPDTASVPPALAGRVAAQVAGLWQVDSARVGLAWGRTDLLPGEFSSAHLVGRGVGGWFAVMLRRADSSEIALRVRAGVRDSVAVAARAVNRGDTLAADDMQMDLRLVWGPPSGAARVGPGWEARRALVPGDLLVPPSVSPPTMVRAGETVVFTWEHGGVSVSVTAVAVNAARLGEPVRGRVEGRPLRLEGVATGPGEASLTQKGSES